MNIEVSYLGVLLAAVASTVLGFLWYSPYLFGKKWMKLMGLTAGDMTAAKKKGMTKMYATSFVLDLVLLWF